MIALEAAAPSAPALAVASGGRAAAGISDGARARAVSARDSAPNGAGGRAARNVGVNLPAVVARQRALREQRSQTKRRRHRARHPAMVGAQTRPGSLCPFADHLCCLPALRTSAPSPAARFRGSKHRSHDLRCPANARDRADGDVRRASGPGSDARRPSDVARGRARCRGLRRAVDAARRAHAGAQAGQGALRGLGESTSGRVAGTLRPAHAAAARRQSAPGAAGPRCGRSDVRRGLAQGLSQRYRQHSVRRAQRDRADSTAPTCCSIHAPTTRSARSMRRSRITRGWRWRSASGNGVDRSSRRAART